MLQPYKAFCHAFCITTMQKARQVPRIVAMQRRSGQALKVKPMLDGRTLMRTLSI